MTAPHRTWVGWLRPMGGTWQAVCQGLTWGSCWARLIAWRSDESVEKVALPKGQHPDDRRRPR